MARVLAFLFVIVIIVAIIAIILIVGSSTGSVQVK